MRRLKRRQRTMFPGGRSCSRGMYPHRRVTANKCCDTVTLFVSSGFGSKQSSDSRSISDCLANDFHASAEKLTAILGSFCFGIRYWYTGCIGDDRSAG